MLTSLLINLAIGRNFNIPIETATIRNTSCAYGNVRSRATESHKNMTTYSHLAACVFRPPYKGRQKSILGNAVVRDEAHTQ